MTKGYGFLNRSTYLIGDLALKIKEIKAEMGEAARG